MTLTEQVRAFNRFYTREIGLLNRRLPGGDLTLPEARVLYEIAHGPESGCVAADIGRELKMDRAHLSRIVGRFRERGLIESQTDLKHGKRLLLTLTTAGRKTFAALDAGAWAQIDGLLAPVNAVQREKLATAMRGVRAALEPGEAAAGAQLRPVALGDLGWIAHRQALIYHGEYGWDWTYEGLACQILGAFALSFDPAREAGWIAEKGGAIVGSVFLMKTDDPALAKLRLLYVEPSARGAGVGRTLVEACIGRARELGYRRLTLWTNDVLVAARRIYQACGFKLTEEAPHHSFGCDLIGQTWVLDLARDPAG